MDGGSIPAPLARHSKLAAQGRLDEALGELRMARVTHGFHVGHGQAEWMLPNRMGRLDEMAEVSEFCIEYAPDHSIGYVAKCWSLFRTNRYGDCLEAARWVLELFPAVFEGYFLPGTAYCCSAATPNS